MKRLPLLPLLCLAIAAGPVHAAAPASDPTQPVPAKDRGTVEKRSEGRVTAFLPGRSLTIEMKDGRTHTLELDEKDVAARVAPSVEVGTRVLVVDSRDATGQRTVTVTLKTASGPTR